MPTILSIFARCSVALWKLRRFDERYPAHHTAVETEPDPASA